MNPIFETAAHTKAISDDLTIAHTPLIAKNRLAIGTRLIINARKEINAGLVAMGFNEQFKAFRSVIFIGLYGVGYDQGLLEWDAPANAVLEIPGSEFDKPEVQDLVRLLHKKGVVLAIRGRASKPLPPEFVDIFKYSVMHASEEKRVKREVDSKILAMRKIKFVMTGITTVADVDDAFERGAVASGGWPMDEAPSEDAYNFRISKETLVKMRNLVKERAAHQEIESVIKQDPALTFKFLRHLHMGGFGNALQISRLKQAFRLVGYNNLARWIEGEIAGARLQEDNAAPLMHASLRRGLFMERLANQATQNADGMFLTGAFSLLDRITKTSFSRLLSMVSVSKEISESISTNDGMWSPHLELVRAIELNDTENIIANAEKLGIALSTVNLALLTALADADDLESDDFLRNIETPSA